MQRVIAKVAGEAAFYAGVAFFVILSTFPSYWMVITSIRPDGELYRPWNSVNYNPFWTWNPT